MTNNEIMKRLYEVGYHVVSQWRDDKGGVISVPSRFSSVRFDERMHKEQAHE